MWTSEATSSGETSEEWLTDLFETVIPTQQQTPQHVRQPAEHAQTQQPVGKHSQQAVSQQLVEQSEQQAAQQPIGRHTQEFQQQPTQQPAQQPAQRPSAQQSGGIPAQQQTQRAAAQQTGGQKPVQQGGKRPASQKTGEFPAQQQTQRPAAQQTGAQKPVQQGARPAAQQSGAMPAQQAGGQQAQAPVRSSGRPVIVFDRVTKAYQAAQRHPALNNISLEIFPGEFVFLVGHSGSGKSTFIRLINREFTASSGKLYVAGEELTKMRSWRVPFLRRNIGCVFQDFKLLPNKTSFQNVAFALEVIGKSRHIIRTQVPEVLRLVGLEDKIDKYPDQLSGGEQQRVSIARAIVNRPPLLICDEPTGNLDPQTSLGIMRLLDRINRTGTTILVATHDREMVDSMRKRVVALENGYLVRDQHKGVYGDDA